MNTRDEPLASLKALPEIESSERMMNVALLVRVDGEFATPRVVGTIVAHGWGVISVRQGSAGTVMVDACRARRQSG